MGLSDPSQLLWPSEPNNPNEFASFAVLADSDGAQLLVQTDSPRAAARSLVRHHAAMGTIERVRRRLASAVARVGFVSLFSSRTLQVDTSSDADDPSLHAWLAEVLGAREVVLSVAFGPPRANRKPVVKVMDRDGADLAFAKIAWNDLTGRLLDNEIETLRSSSVLGLSRVITPQVIHRGTWRSNTVGVFSAVPGTPGRLIPDQGQFAEVASCWTHETCELAESTYVSQLAEAADRATVSPLGGEAVDMLLRRYGDEIVSFAGWHGDWTPWNCAMASGGRIVLWDWERAGAQVPIEFDSIHYRFQSALRKRSRSLDQLIEHSTAHIDGPAERRSMLGHLYTASIALRHLQPDAEGGPAAQAERHLRDIVALLG